MNNMITYELAKKLKEAGFPMVEWIYHGDGSREPYIPTLEELIEACGDRFGGIDHFPYEEINKFRAFSRNPGNNTVEVYGSTPSEAVANLFIELNKK